MEEEAGENSLAPSPHCFRVWPRFSFRAAVLGLQPRDKAAMLGVKTKEYFLEEFTWK